MYVRLCHLPTLTNEYDGNESFELVVSSSEETISNPLSEEQDELSDHQLGGETGTTIIPMMILMMNCQIFNWEVTQVPTISPLMMEMMLQLRPRTTSQLLHTRVKVILMIIQLISRRHIVVDLCEQKEQNKF